MNLHLVAIGANAGIARAANARRVARAVRALPGRVVAASRLWSTPAWPPGAGPDFVNAAALVASPMGPEAMLARLHRLEAQAGRVRGARWGPRVLDLDLVGTGGLVRPGPEGWRVWADLDAARQGREAPDRPILPHPRLADRGFVLLPLAQVAPGWRHPVTGRSVAAMAAALDRRARAGMRPLGPGPAGLSMPPAAPR